VTPAEVTVDAGEAVGVCLTARGGASLRSAGLSVVGAPPGVRAEVRDRNRLGRGCAQLVLLTEGTAAPGDYPLAVVADVGGRRFSCSVLLHVSGAPGLEFTLSAVLAHVAPGSFRPLDVAIANGTRVPIRLTSLRVAVDHVDAAHRRCDLARSYLVRHLSSGYSTGPIPSGTSRSLTALGVPPTALPQISLSPAGQRAGCAGARLTLTYRGTASAA
jgi:hypothetical protein